MIVNVLLLFGMLGWTVNAAVFQTNDRPSLKMSFAQFCLAMACGVGLILRLS